MWKTKKTVANIYRLIDPRTGETRYVGVTVSPIETRLARHITEARAGVNSHKCNWIRALLADGSSPSILLIEVIPITEWQESERFWIAFYRECGSSLTNLTVGGDGTLGHSLTEETRQKLSEVRKGKKKSPEWVAKIIATKKATGVFAAHGEKMRGRLRSEEYRANISKAQKKRVFSQSEIERLRQMDFARIGVPLTEEHRRRIGDAHRGMKRSPETERKISEALTGKKVSDIRHQQIVDVLNRPDVRTKIGTGRKEAWRRKKENGI